MKRKTIPELYRRLCVSLSSIKLDYEIIFVDHGSCDNSSGILEKMVNTDPQIRVIQLTRNFGLSAAVTAGLEHTTGKVVALMDGDLQDRPEELPRMIAKLREGYDVVYCIRVHRKESFFKRGLAYIFYRILNLIASTLLPVDSGAFLCDDTSGL